MERSVAEAKATASLMDDGDYLRVQAEIKELLRTDQSGKPTTFDDLLQMMGKPRFQAEGEVTLADFQNVIRAAGGGLKFSAHEIKQVFRSHSAGAPKQGRSAALSGGEPYIPLRDFKDRFLPALGWKKDDLLGADRASTDHVSAGSGSASRTESMAIDNIMGGKRPEDVARERRDQERLEDKQREKLQAKKLGAIAEQASDALSQDSRVSKPLEEVVGTKWGDPRKKNAQKRGGTAGGAQEGGVLSQEALQAHNAQQKVNQQYYR